MYLGVLGWSSRVLHPVSECSSGSFWKSYPETLKDDRVVLYKTKSLDGTKPNTNPNPNPKLTLILTLFSAFFRALSHILQTSPLPMYFKKHTCIIPMGSTQCNGPMVYRTYTNAFTLARAKVYIYNPFSTVTSICVCLKKT